METSSIEGAPAPSVIGINIGKEVLHLVGLRDGKVAFRRKIKRLALADTFKKLRPCVAGVEACLGAHFVSRTGASPPTSGAWLNKSRTAGC